MKNILTLYKPWIKRQITYRVEEEIGPKKTEDDPWKQNDYQGTVRAKSRGEGSRSAVMIFTFIMCLVAIAALVLILLMWFGKMGERCGCSTSDGKYVDKARLCESMYPDAALLVLVFMYVCLDRSRSSVIRVQFLSAHVPHPLFYLIYKLLNHWIPVWLDHVVISYPV